MKHIPATVSATTNSEAWSAVVAVTNAFMEEMEPKNTDQLNAVSGAGIRARGRLPQGSVLGPCSALHRIQQPSTPRGVGVPTPLLHLQP